MKSSKISVEEVVEKIRTAMSTKVVNEPAQSNSLTPSGNRAPMSEDLLKDLDLELYNNNLRWNIVTELPITSHRKIIGPLLVIGRKLVVKYLRWYINPPHDQQRNFNGSITRSINLLRNIVVALNEQVIKLQSQLSALTNIQKVGTEATNVRLTELDQKMSGTRVEIASLKAESVSQIAQLRADIEKSTFQVGELKNEIAKTRGLLKTIKSERQIIPDQMRRIEGHFTSDDRSGYENPESIPEHFHICDKPVPLDLDYFSFEEKYRGDRADIKNRQRAFLDLFREKGKIVDIGCGRGEFVELLTENGINVTGIDINDDMVRYCTEQGLPVLKMDAFEYLEAMDNNSLGGIFMSQVIEHMQPKEVIRFIRIANTKLKPGGVLLIETIDPSNIVAISTWFYMDLSHTRPLHPLTARFLFESEGFGEIRFIHSNPDKEHEIPALQIDGVSGNLSEFNKSMGHVNKLLNGPQDYAIYGTKHRGEAP